MVLSFSSKIIILSRKSGKNGEIHLVIGGRGKWSAFTLKINKNIFSERLKEFKIIIIN